MKENQKYIDIKTSKGIIRVSIDTFEKDDVIDIKEVIKLCKNIKNERIEIDLDYYKNLQFAIDYGYTPDDIREVIQSLCEKDLHEGPVLDRNSKYKHPFWIFIKYLGDIKIKVYIKLKIVNHKLKINVFRFHKEGMHNESK
mgnify:CR=1 FL=1